VSTTPQALSQADGVLVYRHEAQLVEAGGCYLSDALAGGGAAIAFATADHLRDLEAWVSLCGGDLESAAGDGRYHGVAIETLLETGDQGSDRAAGLQAPLVDALAQVPVGEFPVHVFGEVTPALRERLAQARDASILSIGDALRATRPVSLLCARHEDLPTDAECAEQTRARGTSLVEPPAFPIVSGREAAIVSSAVLPPAPAACGAARRLVRAACESEAGADAIDMAVLVVSEFAGNAVRHARSTFTADVSFSNGSVRLSVTDAQPLPEDWDGFPISREHGLGLVAAIAEDWAVVPLAGGKVVWAELPREEEDH
jgi:hypothetical protein